MAEKITDYTAKSQDFIDTDLFDVSKHVTQTSGVLVVGKRYTILDFNVGDNFTNVASVVSGTINTTGCVFDAIGTTPTTYSNGSTLARYETQSYTYAELKAGLGVGSKVYKALLSQSGTSAPTIESNGTGANTPLVNTLSGTPTFGYTAAGDYTFNLTGEFTSGKVLILMGSVDDPTSVITYNRVSDDTISIKTKIAGVGTNDLLSNISFYVEVYP